MTPEVVRVERRRTLPADAIVWEPSARWVRGLLGAVTVVDSRAPILVWEPGSPVPFYAFPEADVRADLLRPAAAPAEARPGVGEHYDLVVDGAVIADAAWRLAGEGIDDHLAFAWFRRVGRGLDRWFEEDEDSAGHPRDPHKRVDALPSSRHVVVRIAGEVVADSRAPVVLFETGLPVRYYLPREDVRLDLLDPTDLATGCPYKGTAEYWSSRGGTDVPPNIAWSYPDPVPAVAAVRDRIAFYNEAVDIDVDGVPQARPTTVFSAALTNREA